MKLNREEAKNVCPKCGGKIVAEAIGNYGTVYYLKKDGSIGHKIREIKYEHSGEWMYYCTGCGENYEIRDLPDGRCFAEMTE